MIDKAFIEKIEQLVTQGMTVNVKGIDYSLNRLYPIMYTPVPDAVEVNTLSGFVQFIKDNIDGLILKEECFIIVENYKKVILTTRLEDETKERAILASCTLDKQSNCFHFSQFLEQENFSIQFRSMFVRSDNASDDDDFNYILSITSKLSSTGTVETTDDGVSQVVSVKKGVSGNLVEKPIVKLTPYRTFREVKQPESEFLFRIRQKGEAPTIALYDADGGMWKHDAMQNIANYLREYITDLSVIA